MACKKPRSKFNRKCLGNACATCLWWTWNNERWERIWERILGAKRQLIETRRDVIVHMFDHYEERLIKVIEKKGDITDS